MNHIMDHAAHLVQFDSALHWCFLIGLFGFVVGGAWVVVRIITPLRQLAAQAASMAEGQLPTFTIARSGIHEVEQLRRSLHAMMGQIQAAQAREVNYRNALTESQENERKRIARDLHDDTIQSLVYVAHNLERAARVASVDSTQALDETRDQVIQIIDNLRHLIGDLRPAILEELGLADALESLCDQHPGLQFEVQGETYGIDPTQELALYRAAQEAIHNAECHARARHITAKLMYSDAAVRLEVCDDGVGFEVPQQLQELAVRGHYGLIGLRERILHLGGQVALFSERRAGTRITVIIPTAQRALTTV
ncbi:MAG: sensor histidine kinase [Chloroflexi bacterium]|nr:sensor histidine kinase [Chloroflexota bacterium]